MNTAKNKRKIIFASMLAVVVIACLYFLVFSEISPEDIQAQLRETGSWAPVLYLLFFTFLPAIFFPVAVLALAGGLVFGLIEGSVYTLIGAALNCAFMFIIARKFMPDEKRQELSQKFGPKWQKRLQKSAGRSSFILLVILRLIPLFPYNLINYGFALTSMSFRNYMIASMIGIIPGTLVFVNLGENALDPASPKFWLALGLLVLLIIVTSWVGKKLYPDEEQIELE